LNLRLGLVHHEIQDSFRPYTQGAVPPRFAEVEYPTTADALITPIRNLYVGLDAKVPDWM